MDATVMDTIGNFLFGPHKKEMIERRKRQLDRLPVGNLPPMVASREALEARRGGPWTGICYRPHQGKRECARRVRQATD